MIIDKIALGLLLLLTPITIAIGHFQFKQRKLEFRQQAAELKKEIAEIGEVEVIELYAFRTSGKFPTNNLEVVIQDKNGNRRRIYVHHWQAPVHGDIWTLKVDDKNLASPIIILDKLVKRGNEKL